jgi:hypothetical protein
LEFLRVFQEVDHFFDFFFGLVATSHISKCHCVVVLVEHAGFAFAKAESTALATALHLAHEVDPHPNEQQHGAPTDQQGHEQRAFFAGFDVELNIVGNQVTDQTAIQVSRIGTDFAIICGGCNDFSATLPFLNRGRFNSLGPDFFQKIRICQIAVTC